ncbi:competence/damage-inducible protein A, partial [bacterium]|nr:competence/damage-inducible protein A [bacterium]
MRIELFTTGTELLLGFTTNTHVNYVARQLAALGLRLARQTTTADDRDELRAVLAESWQRCDILLVTGGLGPTRDDCTREVAAALFGRPLQRDERVARRIAARFRRRGIPMLESVQVQALVPEGARVLLNEHGTAPGLVLEQDGKLLVLLPGPPRELKPMFEQQLLPLLRQRAGAGAPLDCRVFRVVGLGESTVEEQVAPVLAGLPELELGYCARLGEVEV